MTALLVEVAARRTGYPASSITAESRLLDDLNLDSIKAGELAAEALRAIGAAGALDATRFANSPIRVIAEALHEVAPKICACRRDEGTDTTVRSRRCDACRRPREASGRRRGREAGNP